MIMNTKTIENVSVRLSALSKDGAEKSMAKAMLIVEGLVPSEAAANKAIKDSGLWVQTSRAGGFAADYYDYLAEEKRTEDEVDNYIMAGSNNVIKSKAHYKNIWKLAETIRAS